MNFYKMTEDLATKKLFFVLKKRGFGKNKALQNKKKGTNKWQPTKQAAEK